MSNIKGLFSSSKKMALTLICAGVIAVALGICIVVNAAGRPDQTSAIGGEAAQNYAFADAGVDPVSAKGIKVKYERFQDKFVYEVEFTAGNTEYEYKIDAEDGSVVKRESKLVKAAEPAAPPLTTLTLEEARDIALADAGLTLEQAAFTKAEPDREDGVSVYEFKFRGDNTAYEYEINAHTGAIYSKGVVIYAEQSPSPTSTPAQTPAPASQPPVQTPQATQPPAVSAPPSTPAQSQQDPAYIGVDAAKSAALADAGVDASQASFTKARLDYEDGMPVYEIEFCTSTHEYEYEIHAANGSVCHRSAELCHSSGHHSDDHHDDRHHSAPSPSSANYIGLDAAKNAALSHAGRSADEVFFTKAELDYDDGRAVYEIKFRQGRAEYEYEIDAVTGAILEYDWEQD